MADPDKQSKDFGPKRVFGYIKANPHMVVSVGLFCAGGEALARNITPLAGSLFGAGGALLGAWITELNKRRTDAEDKVKRQAEAVDALAPELQRTIERVQYIVDRAAANFICEAAVNGTETNDQQADFRPHWPILYPSAPQVRDLPGEKAIALIRFYDSLHEIEKLADEWWEREGQLAVHIFNSILHGAEKSLRLGLSASANSTSRRASRRPMNPGARWPRGSTARSTTRPRLARLTSTAPKLDAWTQ